MLNLNHSKSTRDHFSCLLLVAFCQHQEFEVETDVGPRQDRGRKCKTEARPRQYLRDQSAAEYRGNLLQSKPACTHTGRYRP